MAFRSSKRGMAPSSIAWETVADSASSRDQSTVLICSVANRPAVKPQITKDFLNGIDSVLGLDQKHFATGPETFEQGLLLLRLSFLI